MSTDAAKKLLEAFEERCNCPDAAHLAGCRWDEATMLLPEIAPDLLRVAIGAMEALEHRHITGPQGIEKICQKCLALAEWEKLFP